MATATVRQRVLEQYPTLAFLLNDREIGNLLTQAVDPNKGFSATTFQAKLYQTRWWRRRSETQREWEIEYHTDPASAKQRFNSFKAAISARAIRFGQPLSGKQLQQITVWAMRHGVTDPEDPQVLSWLRNLPGGGKGGRGDVGIAAQQVRNLAQGDWYVRPNPKNIYKVAERIATGLDTVESANARFAAEAAARYPHLASRIQGGETLADITSGHRNLVAEELELGDAERVDVMNNPVWRQLLGIKDPKTKKMRMMTDSDVIELARNRPLWWQTAKGRETDATTTSAVLQMFGMRK